MKSGLRILLVEGEPSDGDAILATLADESMSSDAVRISTRADFLQALENNSFDLIVSDCSQPSFDGFSALQLALEKRPGTPFILISSMMGEDLAVETLKSGATDYVLKSNLTRLGPAIRRAVAEATEHAAKQDIVRSLAERETVLRSFFDSPGAMRGVVEVIDNDILHIADNAESAAFFGRTVRKNKLAGERKTLDLWIGSYALCRKTLEPVRFNYLHKANGKEIWLSATVSCRNGAEPIPVCLRRRGYLQPEAGGAGNSGCGGYFGSETGLAPKPKRDPAGRCGGGVGGGQSRQEHLPLHHVA